MKSAPPRQLHGVAVDAVLQIDLEAAGGAQAHDGRRVEHQRHAVRQHHAGAHELAGQILRLGLALAPVLERDEDGAGVGLVAAADQVEAGDDEGVLDGGIFCHGLAHASPVAAVRFRVAPSGSISAEIR
jgi:hypothetical protein